MATKKKETKKVQVKRITTKTAKKPVVKKAVKKVVVNKAPKKAVKKSTTPKLSPDSLTRIKVIGVGGSGKNAINYMIKKDVKGVKFIVANTDVQDLNQSKATKKIHLGRNLTGGVGTGMNPEVGKNAALESKEEISAMLNDTSIVFLTGGMGGGTGTGATPIIAQTAREQGILTIAVVTKPFFFEGNKRMSLAEDGIAELAKHVDAYIVIPNDKILEISDEETSMNEAFALSDDVLLQAVTGISNLITTPGRINIDSSDVNTILSNSGMALVGIGIASGKGRDEVAAYKAINSPLLDVSVQGARSVLFSISAGDDLKMSEVAKIAEIITKEIDSEATVKFGTIRDIKLKKGQIKVTVIASSFEGTNEETDGFFASVAPIMKKERKHIVDDALLDTEVANSTQSEIAEEEEIEEEVSSSWGLPGFMKKD